MLQDTLQLTWNEALSGVFGSISLASWIFLLVPQLVENYQHQSAEGISLTFLFIWFLGDITNLVGALLAHLVPTVVAIAVYFCFADFVLIAQCLYYKRLNDGRRTDGESEPLLRTATPVPQQPAQVGERRKSLQRRLTEGFTDVTEDNVGLPGSRRRSSLRRTESLQSSTGGDPSAGERSVVVKNALSIFGIIAVGTVGWAIAWKSGAWQPTPVEHMVESNGTPVVAQVFGYASAVLYLGARIPQIIKNQRERSCDGLSLLFFILSLIGNATYGAGILFHSVEKTYFLTNLPWLVGSLGTMAEDVTIFIQFSVFGERLPEFAVADT